MPIVGKARVTCPACELEQDAELVQSLNTRTDVKLKARLLAGELNVLACTCGKRTQLAANVLFHDPDADYYCQVCPGDADAMAEAAALFRATFPPGASGTQRLVPSLNALVEKVKILDAKLDDWAIEMTKVLLLASIEPHSHSGALPVARMSRPASGDLDRVLLFERVDRDAGVIHWVRFDLVDDSPHPVASSLDAYARLASRPLSKPRSSELQIDRAWAALAVQAMITAAN